jgi:putative transferase (TIGR04331 family)
MPKCYLEGYENLNSFSKKIYPSAAKIIFDRNSWNTDDVTKIWIAENVENGCEYFVGQHGGNYGVSKWNFTEEHQLAIASKFISWGWTNEKRSNVAPLGNIGSRLKSSKNRPAKGNAMLVEMAVPRLSYHMYSVVVASSQYDSYFEDQIRFVNALPKRLQEELLVKLNPQDYQLSQAARWRDRKPDIRIYNGRRTILEMLDKSRLVISSYNATTYLETLSENVPTLMFWNPAHWELRESAWPYFQQLEEAGILHHTPESAAMQMELVWDDLARWWNAPKTQSARLKFCQNYVNTEGSVLERYSKILSEKARHNTI